jgi:hypothetical protein
MTVNMTYHIESTTTASPDGLKRTAPASPQPDLVHDFAGTSQRLASPAQPYASQPEACLENGPTSLSKTAGPKHPPVLPRHLGGFRLLDLEHAFGRRKAKRIIAWLASDAGPNVIAFPIDRATGPAMRYDPATGSWSRVKPPRRKSKHQPVIAVFRPSGDAA